jgi:sulfate adenylyltransferase subunit 1
MDILRLLTAGSVDDGKSTLIGRLLYDSKSILTDHLETLKLQSKNIDKGNEFDLALLTDGLRAEREQGITIDVAYKYFSTTKRKFIVADTPGHIQYTRNMVTGASTADLMVVLIDARHGVIEQTRRHSFIASLLGIKKVVVAVNKMDLVEYSQSVFDTIVSDYSKIAEYLKLENVMYIPMAAKPGDNVVVFSENMEWYQGPALLEYLENVDVTTDFSTDNFRFQVQYVVRPQSEELHDYRGYAGRVLSGVVKVGDEIVVMPANVKSKIKTIDVAGVGADSAFAPQSCTFQLEDDIDISRGDLFAHSDAIVKTDNEIEAIVCWMGEKSLAIGNKYILQQNSRSVRSVIRGVDFRFNINELTKEESDDEVKLNDLVKITLKTQSPIAYDKYADLKTNGAAVLIDETSNITVGALMFL